jgi:hypothetical protein
MAKNNKKFKEKVSEILDDVAHVIHKEPRDFAKSHSLGLSEDKKEKSKSDFKNHPKFAKYKEGK